MKQPRYLRVISLSAFWLMCSLWPLHALSQEPVNLEVAGVAPHPRIRFSSTLLNEDGRPLAGFHLLTFYIRDREDGRADPLWTETLAVQTDENGQYTVDLMPVLGRIR